MQLGDHEPARPGAVAVVVQVHPGLVARVALVLLDESGFVLVGVGPADDVEHPAGPSAEGLGVHAVRHGLVDERAHRRLAVVVGDDPGHLLGSTHDDACVLLPEITLGEGLTDAGVALLELAREPQPSAHHRRRGPGQLREPRLGAGRGIGLRRATLLRCTRQPQPELMELTLDPRGLDDHDLECLDVTGRNRTGRHPVESIGDGLDARRDRLQRVQDRGRLECRHATHPTRDH